MFDKLKNILRPQKRLEPLVLQDDIWREIFVNLTAIGKGEHVLPSENVNLVFLVAEESERNILNSAFGDNRLEQFLRDKLKEERCGQSGQFRVHLEFISEATPDWETGKIFRISFGSGKEASIPAIIIRILHGKASKKSYKLTKPTINLGRGSEAKDKYGTLVRRNDVDFEDISEEPNNYVSKLHAQIQYGSDGIFYLSDSGFE